MRSSLEKIEFYASKKRERQSDMLKMHKDMSENYSWVQSVTQQVVNGSRSNKNYLAPCEINKGLLDKMHYKKLKRLGLSFSIVPNL